MRKRYTKPTPLQQPVHQIPTSSNLSPPNGYSNSDTSGTSSLASQDLENNGIPVPNLEPQKLEDLLIKYSGLLGQGVIQPLTSQNSSAVTSINQDSLARPQVHFDQEQQPQSKRQKIEAGPQNPEPTSLANSLGIQPPNLNFQPDPLRVSSPDFLEATSEFSNLSTVCETETVTHPAIHPATLLPNIHDFTQDYNSLGHGNAYTTELGYDFSNQLDSLMDKTNNLDQEYLNFGGASSSSFW